MFKFAKEMMLTGLGAIVFTKDKIEEMVDQLVAEGKVSRAEAEKLIQNLVTKAKEQRKDLKERIEQEIENTLDKTGLVKKEEVDELNARVNKLEIHIEALEREISNLKSKDIEENEDDN